MPLQGKKNEPLHSALRTESHHMNKHTYKETREESLPAYLKANYLQPDGTALIEIDLSSTDIFNPLSYGKGRTLNQDIFDLIGDESNLIPATIPLHIRFHAASLTSDQKDEIENLYREYYQALVYDQEWGHRPRSTFHAGFCSSVAGCRDSACYKPRRTHRNSQPSSAP